MSISKFKEEDEKQIVITLALIQQALEGLTARVEDHHKVLFGNGNPENSVVWAIKALTISIEKLDKRLEEQNKSIQTSRDFADVEIKKLKGDDANLTWKQWFKKITIRWLPLTIIAVLIILFFHGPIGELFAAASRMLGK